MNYKAELINSLKEFQHYFECNFDYDPDLLSGDQERDFYRKCIHDLWELGETPVPNYLDKLYEHENQLPY